MRIAFCHNLKTDDTLEQAEFDTPDTVSRIAAALESGGHEVHLVEVSGPLSSVASRLEALRPDLVFNTAEGRTGSMREAFFPSLYEHLGLPYTGAGGHGCALTLDKHLTKRRMAEWGVPVLPSALVTREGHAGGGERGRAGLEAQLAALPAPLLAKPNFEGSGKGISEKSVFEDRARLEGELEDLLSRFPEGILIEPYVEGIDATVGFLEALDPPVLEPTGYRFHADQNRFNLYGYHLKNHAPDGAVEVVAPLKLSGDLPEQLRHWTGIGGRVLGLRDLGRLDFRIAADGRAFFLEANALPSLEEGAGLLRAAELRGLSYRDVMLKVVESACRRWGIRDRGSSSRRPRLALVYNLKRGDTTTDDAEAEYDSPKTIAALKETLESLGNEVVGLEAGADLPVRLSASGAEVVFNIAEGTRGRNRESLVPALCELLDLPCTGSDAATLSICLDKALSKRLLLQAGVPTPRFALFTSSRDALPSDLRFPLIAKPNAEGTSKGLGPESVVEGEEALRALVERLIDRYRQPVIVEEYITGREFTVGLLGGLPGGLPGARPPRVLPPMEVIFQGAGRHPVYGYAFKQDFCPQVSYRCPAELDEERLEALERAAVGAFEALGCRDVARVDLRLDPRGAPHVLEVNPLPGLTPAYSDLCLISEASGMGYRELIAGILAGARSRAGRAGRAGRGGAPG